MIDAKARKMFAQLDDPATAQVALQMLREHFARQKPAMKFAHLAADLEGAVPKQDHEALKVELARWQQANVQCQNGYNKLDAENRSLRAENASLRGGVSVLRRVWCAVLHRPRLRRLACVGALALVVGGGWYVITAEPGMTAEAREKLVALRLQNWSVGAGSPAVVNLVGASWWVKIDRDVDSTSYVDRLGQPISLDCYHFFARPAVSAFGVSYEKPGTADSWKERARVCVTPQQSASAK